MSVLIVRPSPPLVHPLSFNENSYPVGIAFLISALREKGHEVYFIDQYLSPDQQIKVSWLNAKGIDLIGVYMCSITFKSAIRVLENLQVLRESGKWRGRLIVGGPHVALIPDSVPNYVDHLVVGEGEKAIVDIADGQSLPRNIRYKRIRDLDTLPFPAYDVLVRMPYQVRFAMMNRYPLVNISTSRGCPYSCRFCSVSSIWGRSHYSFSSERVVDDFQRLHTDFHFESVYFREDNFLLDAKRTEEICSRFISMNNKVPWGCEARVTDLIDNDRVRALKSAGCVHVFLGLESLSDRVLSLMNKKISVSQIEKAIDICRRNGITPFGSFIMGIPGETEEERITTIQGAARLFPDENYTLNTFMGIPKSPLYEEAINGGLVDYMDTASGFFYIKNHDDLMTYSLKGEVPIHRLSPRPFLEKRIRENRSEDEPIPIQITDHNESFMLIMQPIEKASKNIHPYHGILGLYRQLSDSDKPLYDCFVLLNMLHLVPPNELPSLFDLLKCYLTDSGSVKIITIDRASKSPHSAAMENYYAEYVYSKKDISTILQTNGWHTSCTSELDSGLIELTAQCPDP